MEESYIRIYADWSCLGNPGPWGYAAILMYWDNSKTIKWKEENTTNNRMELKAVIEALKALKKTNIKVYIYIDSDYVYKGITSYINSWEKNNWKTSSKEEVKNKDLWQELSGLNKSYKIEWNWVEAHSDDQLNNLVDKIARKEAESLK